MTDPLHDEFNIRELDENENILGLDNQEMSQSEQIDSFLDVGQYEHCKNNQSDEYNCDMQTLCMPHSMIYFADIQCISSANPHLDNQETDTYMASVRQQDSCTQRGHLLWQ